MNKIKPYAKAVLAFAIPLAGGIAAGYADDRLTTGEIWSAVAVALATGGAVYGVRNAQESGR